MSFYKKIIVICFLLLSYWEGNVAVLWYKAKKCFLTELKISLPAPCSWLVQTSKTCLALWRQKPGHWQFTTQIQPVSTTYFACNFIPNISFLRTPFPTLWRWAPTCTNTLGHGCECWSCEWIMLCLDCVQWALDIHAVGRLAFSQRWRSFILMPTSRG